MKNKKGFVLITLIILAILIGGAIYLFSNKNSVDDSNQKIAYWAVDNITLMKIPETGNLACFGCGNTMCIDPIQGLEVIEESFEAYCDSDLNVIKSD